MRLALERTPTGKRELALYRGDQKATRTPEPLEGTRVSLFNTLIPSWWSANDLTPGVWAPGGPDLADKVWVANRCIQLNAQQIATMPLEFHGPDGAEPAWLSSPDPHWFPNGIGDALHFIVEQIYGWGYCCLYVTDLYADGFPRTWTVLDNRGLKITLENGSRAYEYGTGNMLAASRVVQIDRNPGARLKGTSALAAYAQAAWGLLAAGNQSMTVNQGGIPFVYLKSDRKLSGDKGPDGRNDAERLQDQWMAATQRRNGAPPVVPPEIEPKELTFDPKDMALIETQEFNAKAIMTAFGVPSPLLNMAIQGGLTYQNPAGLGEMWWRFELRQMSTRLMNAFSAQMLPRGQFVTAKAEDTFAPITGQSTEDDPQASQVAGASPAQQRTPLTAIGGGAG